MNSYTIYGLMVEAYRYNFMMLERAWVAMTQLAAWTVDSLPAGVYFLTWAFVYFVSALISAIAIYRTVDWLHRGGLRYSAIKRAKKRRQMAGR